MARGTTMAPILWAGGTAVLAVAAGLAIGDGTIEAARLAARYTARAAFPFFLLVYVASSLVVLWPNDTTRALLRARRYWGLGFALAHGIHLAALATYLELSGEVRGIVTLLGGGGAYVLLLAMALTSNDAAVRALGPWWKRLHTVGIHWLWFVFAFSYFGRLSDPERFVQGAVLFPLAVGALGLRVAAWWKRRRVSAERAAVGGVRA